MMSIEVKTTTAKAGEFIITRHEWDTALESRAHRFHLWDISRSGQPLLAELGVDAMRPHVASDQGLGRWERLSVPFSAFGAMFAARPNPVD
jgi:hypothetical protein